MKIETGLADFYIERKLHPKERPVTAPKFHSVGVLRCQALADRDGLGDLLQLQRTFSIGRKRIARVRQCPDNLI